MGMVIKEVNVVMRDAIGFTCDKCSEYFSCNDPTEWQEMVRIKHNAGYGSLFGDGNYIDLTICNKCAYEMFKDLV